MDFDPKPDEHQPDEPWSSDEEKKEKEQAELVKRVLQKTEQGLDEARLHKMQGRLTGHVADIASRRFTNFEGAPVSIRLISNGFLVCYYAPTDFKPGTAYPAIAPSASYMGCVPHEYFCATELDVGQILPSILSCVKEAWRAQNNPPPQAFV